VTRNAHTYCIMVCYTYHEWYASRNKVDDRRRHLRLAPRVCW
jgi:hypothetical protein